MPAVERLTVTMPAEMAETLRRTVAGGEYASTSEVVREALREWTRARDAERRDLDALRAHLAAPHMVTAGGGSIVNISSVNGFVGAPGISGYVTSKFGIRGLTRTAALELGRSNIRVNSIHPGPIDTAMVQPQSWGGFDMRPVMANMMPLGRIGRPDEVAMTAVFLASDEASYVTGANLVIDGGWSAVLPGLPPSSPEQD